MNKKKILITGGTGFIGYHLSKKCIKLNWSVTSLSTKYANGGRKIKGVRYVKCDISKKKDLKRLKTNFDYIVNLAGYVDHSNKSRTMKSHFNGCKNLSIFFMKKDFKKFLQIGSSVEYGKKRSPNIENEKNPQKTFSVYGDAKLKSTKYLLRLNKNFGFPVSILRPYLIYGPHQSVNRLIPFVITNAIQGKTFNCSDGKQLRDFLYIDDFIEAIYKSLISKKNIGEIVNIGSGKPIKIREIINRICKMIGSGNPKFGKIKLRKDETNKLYPNIKKARKLLKWKPKIKLNSGLKKTINYYVQKYGKKG